jgi:hypothetical protein
MSKKIKGDWVWLVDCRYFEDIEWTADRVFSTPKKAKRHVQGCEDKRVKWTKFGLLPDGSDVFEYHGRVEGEDFAAYRIKRYLFDV